MPVTEPPASDVASAPGWSRGWALIGALLTLPALFLFHFGPIQSVDVWWHMVQGRLMLETGSLVLDHTRFTWTPARTASVYCTWTFDLITYAVHRIGGTNALIALRLLVMGTVLALTLRLAARRGVLAHPLTWVVLVLSGFMAQVAGKVSPQLGSYLLMGASVYLWFRIRGGGEAAWKWVYLFPLISLAWVNSHAMFLFGVPLIGFFFVGDLLNARFAPDEALPARVRFHLFWAGVLCIGTVFLTPYGVDYLLFLKEHLGHGRETPTMGIAEYTPTRDANHAPFFLMNLLLLGQGLLVALILARPSGRRFDWSILLPNLFYMWLYVEFSRTTFFWAPLLAMSCIAMLGERRGPLWPAGAARRVALGVGILGLCAALMAPMMRARMCRPVGLGWLGPGIGYRHAVEAADYLKGHGPPERIANTYGEGSYLIHALWPEAKVMVDPRHFPFIDWIAEYLEFDFGWRIEPFVERFPADVWVVGHSYPVARWFHLQPGWELRFFGPVASVFVRSGADTGLPSDLRVGPGVDGIRNEVQARHAVRAALYGGRIDLAERIHAGMEETACRWCAEDVGAVEGVAASIEGVRAYRLGQHQRAADLLRHNRGWVDLNWIQADALHHLCIDAHGRGDVERALWFALAGLEARPDHPGLLMTSAAIGIELSREGRYPAELPPWSDALDRVIQNEVRMPRMAPEWIEDFLTLRRGELPDGFKLPRPGEPVVRFPEPDAFVLSSAPVR